MLQQMAVRAKAGAEAAQRIARTEAWDRGDYANGIKAERAEVDPKDGRATAYVDATDFKSHWMEFGTRARPALHILTRAVQVATGLPVARFGKGGGP